MKNLDPFLRQPFLERDHGFILAVKHPAPPFAEHQNFEGGCWEPCKGGGVLPATASQGRDGGRLSSKVEGILS